jgi:hypothetical protein
MRRKSAKRGLVRLGLGALLVGMVISLGMAGASAQTSVQPYTGQIREITIDECGPQPGTCAGSVVLEQPRGREVALAIRPGTRIQRGDQLVYLSELGIGNYVRLQATPLPERVPRPGTVGSSPGERPYRLHETSGE